MVRVLNKSRDYIHKQLPMISTCRYTGIQAYGYTGIRVYRYTGIWVRYGMNSVEDLSAPGLPHTKPDNQNQTQR